MESVIVNHVPHAGSVVELGSQTYRGKRGFKSTKEFYLSLGFSSYDAIDLDGKYGALKHDLNEPVDIDRKWTLVTNNGTGEHLFDQGQVFRTCHKLSNEWIVYVLPWVGWIEHGFFNYQPNLFIEMAMVNDYDIRTIGHANRNELHLHSLSEKPGPGNISIVVVIRKRSDKPFVAPNQKKWVDQW